MYWKLQRCWSLASNIFRKCQIERTGQADIKPTVTHRWILHIITFTKKNMTILKTIFRIYIRKEMRACYCLWNIRYNFKIKLRPELYFVLIYGDPWFRSESFVNYKIMYVQNSEGYKYVRTDHFTSLLFSRISYIYL